MEGLNTLSQMKQGQHVPTPKQSGTKVRVNCGSGLTFSVGNLPVFVEIGEEQTVDQGGFTQTGFP